ncbi:heme peroxidase [Desarmillaria ectypa]|nr:heme peroxidase [Desarmillaria ectypa]
MSFNAIFRARAPLVLAAARPARVNYRSAFRRFNSTQAPTPKSNTGLYVGLAALAIGGGAGYYYLSDSSAAPAQATTFTPTKEDYQKVYITSIKLSTVTLMQRGAQVYNKIADIFEDGAENYDDGSFAPVLLRLAWHSSGTYDKETKTGGSNYATMRFAPESLHGANAGLNVARDIMEKVKAEFPWISYGDLWTLGGVCAIQEMAGPKIPWRPGRVDGIQAQATPDGRLPDASQGADHLRHIFYRMGFNDQEIVALSGGHAVGRCHADRSGFDGPWTFSPTTLTNDFYKLLFEETWVWRKWGGPKQLQDKKTKSLMMLPTDYVLTQDKSFKKYAKAYADDQDLFFKDFAAAVSRLFELGVPTEQFATAEPWIMKSSDEK